MKALVIYDSVFGNTEKVAQAIGKALGTKSITVKKVTEVGDSDLKDVDWIITGSPTRAFRPSEGMTAFLKKLAMGSLKGIRAVVFDTRIPLETIKSKAFRFIVSKGGYAAPAMAKVLQTKGAEVVGKPEGFFVLESEGPLAEGELERAAAWVKSITKNQ